MSKLKSRISVAIVAAVVAFASAGVSAEKGGAVPDGKGGGACITVTGGGGSSWEICDGLVTSNGLPAGGTCENGPGPGTGAAISDASTTTGGGDAFDLASLLFVNNAQVGGVGTQTGNSVAFAPSSAAGLTRNLRYDVLTSQATTRVVLTLTNTTGASLTPTVTYVGNFGSDEETEIDGTFSGDTLFTTADEWIVTSDDDGGGKGTEGNGDPVNTSVFFGGTMTPPSTPTSVSQTAFDCADTDGYNVAFAPTVPANGSVTFLFFQRMSDTAAIALPAAADFTNIEPGSPLLAGLSAAELAQLVNFAFGPVAPPAPIPTLSPNLMVLLGVVLALFGFIAVRMHQSRG